MSNANYAAKLDQAQSELRRLKENLIASIQESLAPEGNFFSAERIAKAANRIASCEGEVRAFSALAKAQEKELDLKDVILRNALRAPDDQWSGRSNDVARAFADGLRSTLDDAIWDL